MNTKKILTIALCSVLTLGVVSGCSVKAKKPTETSSESSATEREREREREVYGTYAIPDRARNNQVEMQVDSVEVVVWEQVDMFNTVTTTHNFIKAHVVITNLSNEDLELQPRDIRGYIDNEQLTVNTNESAQKALGINGDVIEQRTIHPGRSETGYVLYEYFRNWTEFEVQYKESDLDFGIKFDEDSVINLRTSADPKNTEETSESSDGSDTSETSGNEPLLTIPGTNGGGVVSPTTESTEPSTQPIEPTSETTPGITIPVASGT